MITITEERNITHLDMSRVKKMAAASGMSNDEMQSFLEMHNSIGHFVYFNDPQLRQVIITDPQWLVDMCKAVITNNIFLEERNITPETLDQLKRGLVNQASLAELWPGEDVNFLVSLMLKFNLFLPLKEYTRLGQSYLIPCMLPPYNTNDIEPYMDMVCLVAALQKALFGDNMLVATFHKLLSLLTITTQWDLSRKEPLSYSEASLDIGKSPLKENLLQLRLTLSKGNEIESSIWCHRDKMTKDLTPAITSIKEVLFRRMAALNIGPPEDVLVLCPHFRPADNSPCMVKGQEIQNFRVKLCEEKCRLHKKLLPSDDYIWLFST